MEESGERRSQAEAPPVQPLDCVQFLFEAFKSGQQGLGKGQELLPGRGEAQPPFADALQQPAVQLVFQGLHLLAQGRLGPEGGLRGPGEAPQFGHLVEAQELLYFHKNNLYKI